ncbi:MAG: PAS domain S-box protein [Methanothrix sp.]|nr:MAG: PAS domain S-box protein [Methanothrix sp.]
MDGKPTYEQLEERVRQLEQQSRARQETILALEESVERYSDLVDNAGDLIHSVTPDGTFLYVNRAWREALGYSEEEIDGLSILDIISPDCHDRCQETFKRIISEEDVHSIDTVFVSKEGRKIIIEGNACCKFQDGKPVSIQCIFRDVTEKKKLEEELLKGQKLESLGVFADGIAHDFNNLLTAILGNISLAKIYLNGQDEAYKRLDMTEKVCLRARTLTQQLLAISKGGAPIKKTTPITALIKDSTSLILRGSHVKCVYDLAEDLWSVEVDEGQLSQVTQNLAINASRAMPSGGILTIRARNVDIAPHNLLTMPAGRDIELAFQDEGAGIPQEHIDKIFDPYFSSKRTGSGLGLTIAYSIIKKHDGTIIVDSEIGKGPTFIIYLPATDKTAAVRKENEETSTTSQGRVLIMDDEEIVREIAIEMLGYIGCETAAAKDGSEAIELYMKAKEEGKPFDAVLMDLTIVGGMGGKEAIMKLRAIDPDVKAVVSSGYANDPIMANYKEYGFCGVVPKPYKIHELSSTFGRILNEAKG